MFLRRSKDIRTSSGYSLKVCVVRVKSNLKYLVTFYLYLNYRFFWLSCRIISAESLSLSLSLSLFYFSKKPITWFIHNRIPKEKTNLKKNTVFFIHFLFNKKKLFRKWVNYFKELLIIIIPPTYKNIFINRTKTWF